MKNRFLTTALALGIASCFGLTAMAQDQQTPPPESQNHGRTFDPARQARNMSKKLGLTADQESKLVPILADRNQQMLALRADTTLSAADRHAKMLGLRQDNEAKVKALLTDAQKQQYDELRQQMKAKNHTHKS